MADEKNNVVEKPIGKEGVNHLVKIYLGRDATADELDRFEATTGADDAILRDYLKDIQTTEKEQAKETGNAPTEIPTSAFFRGGENGALIKFSDSGNDSTVWWVDPKTKTLRPIMSEQAFNNAFEETLEEVVARDGIATIPLATINQGSALGGFTTLPDQYGVKNDGTYERPESTFDVNKIKGRYGKPRSEDLEKSALKQINGFLKVLKSDPNSGITPALIDEISNNEEIIGTYLNAFAYGEYQLPDIFRDLKRRELISEGNESMKDVKVIDETTLADAFYRGDGASARTNPLLTPPTAFGDISTSLLESSIFNIPDEVFEILVPPLDFNSPEGQAEMDKIKSAYHDVLITQIEAKNEREKVIADQNWENFRTDIDKKYGIKLSDNANSAWEQIVGLGSSLSERNLLGTGIEREAVDKYLKDIRKGDQRLRDEKITTEERENVNHLLQSGSPEEIAAMSDEDKVKYGLKPSEDVKDFFSVENLKKQYPNLSDEELQAYANSILDENGNYRSQIFQTMAANVLQANQAKRLYQQGDVQVDPDTGKVIGGYGLAYEKALEEEKAYDPFREGETYSKPVLEDTTATDPSNSDYWNINTDKNIVEEKPAIEKPTVEKPIEYITGYDQSGKAVQVEKGKYSPGISLTPPAKTQEETTKPSYITGYDQSGKAVQVEKGKYSPGISLTPPTTQTNTNQTTTVDPFKEFTKGKTDVLGKNWEGYSAISGTDYKTPEQKKQYKNVQQVGSTLYGYKG